MLQTQKILL